LVYSAAAFADDQIIAGPQIALHDFREGAVLETELNRDRCRPSLAQDPDLRRVIQWRLFA